MSLKCIDINNGEKKRRGRPRRMLLEWMIDDGWMEQTEDGRGGRRGGPDRDGGRRGGPDRDGGGGPGRDREVAPSGYLNLTKGRELEEDLNKSQFFNVSTNVLN